MFAYKTLRCCNMMYVYLYLINDKNIKKMASKKNFRFYKEHLKQLNKEKNKSKSVIGKNVLQKVK